MTIDNEPRTRLGKRCSPSVALEEVLWFRANALRLR